VSKTAKPKPAPIRDWAEADAALCEMGQCQVNVGRLDTSLQLRLTTLKFRYVEDAKPFLDREAELREGLELFWLAHRDDVAPAKSRALNFGALGTRASRAVAMLRGWTKEKAIAALSAGLADFLRPKPPDISRERVLDATPEELALLRKCGLGIEERETFFAEPDLEKLRQAAPAA